LCLDGLFLDTLRAVQHLQRVLVALHGSRSFILESQNSGSFHSTVVLGVGEQQFGVVRLLYTRGVDVVSVLDVAEVLVVERVLLEVEVHAVAVGDEAVCLCVCCVLFVVCCLLCVVCCLLFVVCVCVCVCMCVYVGVSQLPQSAYRHAHPLHPLQPLHLHPHYLNSSSLGHALPARRSAGLDRVVERHHALELHDVEGLVAHLGCFFL
jgi:hypothetical protein